MKFYLLFLSTFAFFFNYFSQDNAFAVHLHLENPTSEIEDVSAKISVNGGVAPYRFYWNQNGISIYKRTASGLPEGALISVTVIDSQGNVASASSEVPASSVAETFNIVMKPAVATMESFLFYSLWSDTVKVKDFTLKAPFALDATKEAYILKEWLVDQNTIVAHEQPIAMLAEGDSTFYLYAVGNGRLEQMAKSGEPVFFQNKRGNRSETVLGKIHYANPEPFYYANLTTKSQGVPLIVVWLILGAVFFTLRMRFINVRGALHAIQLVRGKYDDPTQQSGEVSHFQALVTALSGTVGLGNIAGVAIAVSVGGPGATFWMIVAGLIGMSSKFVECTLGVKYREIDENGEVFGGPMYYLSRGLERRNLKRFGQVLAVLFAILCVGGSFGGGNMFQANQALNQLKGIPGWEGLGEYGLFFGIGLAFFVGIVIIGGIKSIARVTDKIVPAMVGIYVLSALVIIWMNFGNIGEAFGKIFQGAFNPDAVYGGVIGVLILGFQRAAFSNEAGVGSSAIAHAAAKTKEPVSEGIVALLEPFIDTVLVCTMTALVIIFTGYADDAEGLEGAQLTSAAFSSSLGDWSLYVLAFAAVLFAFSTMISWSYYGLKAWTYLFGKTRASDISYKFLFLIFVVVGSTVSLGAVIGFSDLMILGMAFPNILGLLIMSGEVKQDLTNYLAKIKSGVIHKFK
jgi:alanine or glycine:cation symporter, AGCS family